MNFFWLYVCILSIFIITMAYYNVSNENWREPFHHGTNSKTYILLGDSILQNDVYVSDGQSIQELLLERNKQVYSFAKDHSKVVDIFGQIGNIPMELNSPHTYVFLSGGGNDILFRYVEQSQKEHDNNSKYDDLYSIFENYVKVVKSIQARLPEAKMILLDIYYPNNDTYKQYHSIIEKWNKMVYDFAHKPENNVYDTIEISKILTQQSDFSNEIEPSENGGEKIATSICRF